MNKKMLFLLIIGIFSLLPSISSAFTDIENSVYENDINQLGERLVIDTTRDKFEPRLYVSRAEFLKMVLLGSSTEIVDTAEVCFSDISSSDWYTKYTCIASNQGIVNGFEDGTFRPSDNVTMLEALAFTMRAFDIDLGETDEGEEWFQKYRDYSNENKIFLSHEYNENTQINRGQAAKLINTVYNIVNKKNINNQKQLGCSINKSSTNEEVTLTVNGKKRTFLLNVPEGYDNTKKQRLIFAFHGRTNNANMVRGYMGLGGSRGGKADTIVVYPQGLGAGPYSWSGTENLQFFDAILEYINNNYCVDQNQIFAVGHSMGGYMSNKIACLRGDIIRGVVTVAGTNFEKFCDGAVASAQFHLSNDHLVSYSNATRQISYLKNYNNCSETSEQITLGGNSCTLHTSCDTGNEVILCNSYSTYLNDPHSWPKKGGEMVFDFIGRHR